MKKILISTFVTTLCAGVCLAATYTIKSTSSGTTIKSNTPAKSTNIYNNYSAGQYVANNTVNSSYAGVVDIVMDFSGSMSGAVQVAKNTMSSVVAQIPSSIQVGFRVFGQGDATPVIELAKVKGVQKSTSSSGKTVYKLQTGQHQSSSWGGTGCKVTTQVTPISTANATNLINGMNSVSLGGSTPMVFALQEAVDKDLSKFDRNTPKKIVLITDGGENCGGDPCSFARTLMAIRRDIQIDVVLVSSYSRGLSCLAKATGGTMYNLSNANQLTEVLKQSIKTPVHSTTPINTQQENQYQPPQQQYEFINE